MKLFIDAGNTRVKFGWHDGQQWLHTFALTHTQQLSAEKLPQDLSAITHIAGVNVAGDVLARKLQTDLQLRWPDVPIQWLHASQKACGVTNNYRQPQQLGADRWAALIAAWHTVQTECLVVNMGTATTMDVLSHKGQFLGGCIVPGLNLMLSSLAAGTHQLPDLNIGHLPSTLLLPRSTEDAIHMGCLHAQLGAITQMRANVGPDALLVISGGARQHLLPYLSMQIREYENMVLDGVRLLATE